MKYNPSDWYWRAEDGRVFASARQEMVVESDPDYVAFAEVQAPSSWPRDDAGEQTDAELQKVLDPYGIFVTLESYAAFLRWQMETAGITSTAGVPLRSDDRGKTMIIGAGLLASNDESFTTTWVAADGSFHELAAAQLKEQVGDLQRHIDDCFKAYVDAINQLHAGKMTTRKQVEERFAKLR